MFHPNRAVSIIDSSATTSTTGPLPKTTTTTVLHLAGGFGSSSSSAAASKGKRNKKKKKNKTNKKRGGSSWLSDIDTPTTDPSSSSVLVTTKEEEENGPKLDRFGLPIQTIEDIFPPLPDSTELIGVQDEEKTDMSQVRMAMERYISLNYDLFDENGVEKEELCNLCVGVGGDDDSSTDGKKRVPWKLKMIHQSPPVFVIENFFTPEECEEYINMVKPEISTQSTTTTDTIKAIAPLQINSATFSAQAQSTRTSTTWYCHFSQVSALLAKSRRLLGPSFPLERMEESQIVRYRTGEEFSWHYDEVPSPSNANGGQRVGTLLVYLSTIDEGRGGGTVFRDLKPPGDREGFLKMQPRQGSALLFFPATEDGTPDDRTLHKGEVAIDEKMIAQMWLHERDYEPVVPKGNSHEEAKLLVEKKEMELGFL